MKQSTFSIIGERYLDTQHSPEYIEKLEAELKIRNVTGLKRWFYEYIAAAGLCWNWLWWEWAHLDEKHIKIGWVQSFICFGVLAVWIGIKWGFSRGLITFLILHLLSVIVGFIGRAGTK